MRLVFIDPEPVSETGGGIRAYIRLAAALCRRQGWTVSVYSHNPGAYPGFESHVIERQVFLPRGVRALAYRFVHGEAVAFEHARWLSQIFRTEKPDMVEFADFQGYAFFALRDARLARRVCVRVHTPLHTIYAGTSHAQGFLKRIAFLLLRWRERNCLRRSHYVTVPSAEFVREKLSWLRKYHTLPNPPPEPDPHPAPNSLDPSPDPMRLLFLGRLEPRKGARELLKAFLVIAKDFPTITLTFIGDAVDESYQAELHGMLASVSEPIRNRVQWLPARRGDKSPFLREYSLLIVPSLWENSPYVFWEGMAAGLPCLGSETGEMKRAREWTQAPCLPPGDSAALADALWQALTSRDFCAKLLARQKEYLHALVVEAEKLPQYYSQCAAQASTLD